jgi:hypothetical protein
VVAKLQHSFSQSSTQTLTRELTTSDSANAKRQLLPVANQWTKRKSISDSVHEYCLLPSPLAQRLKERNELKIVATNTCDHNIAKSNEMTCYHSEIARSACIKFVGNPSHIASHFSLRHPRN